MPNTITLTQLIAYLRTLATEYGSQHALAKELGVSDAFVSDVFAGKRRPGPRMLAALGRRECEPRYEVVSE